MPDTYRVLHKRIRRIGSGEVFEPGDHITPTDAELRAYRDKLDPVSDDADAGDDADDDADDEDEDSSGRAVTTTAETTDAETQTGAGDEADAGEDDEGEDEADDEDAGEDDEGEDEICGAELDAGGTCDRLASECPYH